MESITLIEEPLDEHPDSTHAMQSHSVPPGDCRFDRFSAGCPILAFFARVGFHRRHSLGPLFRSYPLLT